MFTPDFYEKQPIINKKNCEKFRFCANCKRKNWQSKKIQDKIDAGQRFGEVINGDNIIEKIDEKEAAEKTSAAGN